MGEGSCLHLPHPPARAARGEGAAWAPEGGASWARAASCPRQMAAPGGSAHGGARTPPFVSGLLTQFPWGGTGGLPIRGSDVAGSLSGRDAGGLGAGGARGARPQLRPRARLCCPPGRVAVASFGLRRSRAGLLRAPRVLMCVYTYSYFVFQENVHWRPQLGHQQERPDRISVPVWRGCGLYD